MKKLSYFIENTNELDKALTIIADKIPCFVERKYIEMNFSEVIITVRKEDACSVEVALAALV